MMEAYRAYADYNDWMDMTDAMLHGMTDAILGTTMVSYQGEAFDFGKPFAQWKMPKGFQVLRRRLESDCGTEGRREFIKILRLLEKHSLEELEKAIQRALAINATTVDVIRILLQDNRERPAKLFTLDGRPHLQDHSIPEPHIYKYNQLLSSENDNHEETRNQKYGITETSPQGTETSEHAQ